MAKRMTLKQLMWQHGACGDRRVPLQDLSASDAIHLVTDDDLAWLGMRAVYHIRQNGHRRLANRIIQELERNASWFDPAFWNNEELRLLGLFYAVWLGVE